MTTAVDIRLKEQLVYIRCVVLSRASFLNKLNFLVVSFNVLTLGRGVAKGGWKWGTCVPGCQGKGGAKFAYVSTDERRLFGI